MIKIPKITTLKVMRIQHGMTQSDLAGKLNVATSSIGGFERGENPIRKEMAEKIATILGEDLSTIFNKHKRLKDKYVARGA